MLAWAFIPNFSCESYTTCTKANNWGWRYLVLSLGAITFVGFLCRFFLFTLYESPKFLVSRGRQDEAVAAVQGIAHKNRTTTWLTEDILNEIGGYPEKDKKQGLSTGEIIRRSLERFSYQQVAPLFKNKRTALSSTPATKGPTHAFPMLTLSTSYSYLVLLDVYRNGLYPVQRFPSSVFERQFHNLRDLSELRHHRSLWYSRTASWLVHCRHQIHRSQGNNGRLDLNHRNTFVLLHGIEGSQRSIGLLLVGVFLPNDHVWCSIRLHA